MRASRRTPLRSRNRNSATESVVKGRRSVVLENPVARLVVDLRGGSFVDFHFRDQKLNPLVWNNEVDPALPAQMSHFLCLDRWGAPSEAEAHRGMPYHGEAGLVEWEVTRRSADPDCGVCVQMKAHLPIAGIEVRRRIDFDARGAHFAVTEEVINLNRLGCVFNVVQHPSIGPPFLDENTMVDANAAHGFSLAGLGTNPPRRSFRWPRARNSSGALTNLRRLTDSEDPNIVAYVVEEEHGWTTAANPTLELLIGYIWNATEYPWFNAWRRLKNGKPFARGLEFGTTGLNWPHGELIRKGHIFDRPLLLHLDAGATMKKSFACFLFKIPKNYAGVGGVKRSGARLTIIERKGRGARRMTMPITRLQESSAERCPGSLV